MLSLLLVGIRICASQYTSERINDLIKIGLFRTVNDMLLLDSTVIVREDIKSIRDYLEAEITCLADKIVCKQKEIYCCVGSIKNGFDEKMNLYHLLCGAVFDGDFFDYLRENNCLPHLVGIHQVWLYHYRI